MRSPLPLLVLLFAPAASAQEEIYLVDGKVLAVDRVLNETYTEITFRKGNSEGRKPAEEVLRVEHHLGSSKLDDYAHALDLMNDGDFVGAIQVLNETLGDERIAEDARLKWVRQHAIYQQIQCMFSLADLDGVVITADKLLKEVPDTFFYGPALRLKADALRLKNDVQAAQQAYAAMAAACREKGLPELWEREAELGTVLLDQSLKGKALQSKLEGIVAKNAEKYPTVANRATVEIGNAMVADKDYDQAERFFRKIVDGGRADGRTEAGAYAGLGECAYQRGLHIEESDPAKAREEYQNAVLYQLRVVTMHRDVVDLIPRSMYYAVAAFKRLGDRPRALDLAGRMARSFERSPWTEKAKQELNVR